MVRRRALVAVIALLALGASACAGSGGTTGGSQTSGLSPFQVVSQASSKTQAAKTARMSMTMNVSAGDAAGSGAFTMTGSGAVDIAKQAAKMSFAMSGLGAKAGSMSFDVVVTGGAVYMHLPAAAATHLPSGKSWIKIDLAALARQAGVGLGGLSGGSMAAFDPSQQLAYLKGVSKSVTHVGTETVRGTPTQRYHVVIDPKKAYDKASGSLRCGLGAAQRMLGNVTIPADLWIDGQGRLRRMEMHFSTDVPGTTKSVGMTMKMDLYDFGAPVHVTAPPASQVYDATANISSGITQTCAGQQA